MTNPLEHAGQIKLLELLTLHNYQFVTPTPLTHQRVLNSRQNQASCDLRDVFGWNLPFVKDAISAEIVRAMEQAQVIKHTRNVLQSRVRVSSIGSVLLMHSSYPTTQDDAVFMGPDTYRFVRFIRQAFAGNSPQGCVRRILDIGCGSGAGALVSAQFLIAKGIAQPDKLEVVMNDINPKALALTRVNAQVAKVPAVLVQGDTLSCVEGSFDLIICNPPYLNDSQERAYRHGGGELGQQLAIQVVMQALSRLNPGGRLLLYTGVAIMAGKDALLEALAPTLKASGYVWSYEEIDPDIFGEELEQPQYANAERIAAVGLAVQRPAHHRKGADNQ